MYTAEIGGMWDVIKKTAKFNIAWPSNWVDSDAYV
jgi:hypothetical protein